MPDTNTPKLGLRYIFSNQSQKEILINDNFKKIDNFAKSIQDNGTSVRSSISSNKVRISVSESGSILFNDLGNVQLNVAHISIGKYRITMADESYFDRNRGLFVTTYAYSQNTAPFFSSIVFDKSYIDISVFYFNNGAINHVNAAFSLVYG